MNRMEITTDQLLGIAVPAEKVASLPAIYSPWDARNRNYSRSVVPDWRFFVQP